MLKHCHVKRYAAAVILLALLGGSSSAQVEITQAKAVAGNVTPGDARGFPVTITRPGSYILKTQLIPPAGRDGIEIKSHDVTIDFNGYRMQGNGTARRAIISVDNTYDTALIKNGVIAGFKNSAILGHDFWTVQDMRILFNGGGIILGESARVQGNTFSHNGASGVGCTVACLIENNVIDHNDGWGVVLSNGTVLGNAILYNSEQGLLANGGGGLVGYGNNTLFGNNNGGAQVVPSGVTPLQPNACAPTC